ncbi:MAG: hypothetical protein L0I24_00820 [Pseudonocardia sp.]|nr:hypothetical protein [Pseudonocardia sp.]
MPPDLIAAVPLIVSIVGALGVGGLIGQWYASGKDRRAARAALLTCLGDVEDARSHRDGWAIDNPRLSQAIRKLETAALIANVPRSVVVPYAQLATAGLWHTEYEVNLAGDPEAASLPPAMAEATRNAAAIVSRAVWSTPATRWWWLSYRLAQLDKEIAAISHVGIRSRIERAQHLIR